MIDVSMILPFVKDAFLDWLNLFVSPLKNLDMLWIIVPIWGVWVFSEFFQEKKGTSFGNAISNGATMLFVGVDWMRHTISGYSGGELTFGVKLITLVAVSMAVLVYGLVIIILGIKANKLVRIIGRVRETTYFMVMFSPVIYGVEALSLRLVATTLVFFPLFYIIVEVFDRLMPTPSTLEEDELEGKTIAGGSDADLLGSGNDFGSQLNMPGQWPQAPQAPQQQQWPRQQPQQPRQGYYPGNPNQFSQQQQRKRF